MREIRILQDVTFNAHQNPGISPEADCPGRRFRFAIHSGPRVRISEKQKENRSPVKRIVKGMFTSVHP